MNSSDTSIKIYDSLQKKEVEIKTLQEGILTVYSCGPTVYNYVHIGNMRSFLTADLLVRTATCLGYKALFVSNITDVGHLTTDDVADSCGEDKLAKALKSKEGECFQNVWELSEYYAECYIQDSEALNITTPLVRPKATQHIQEQIRAIEKLIEDGFAYVTDNAVYFDISKFPEYGKLSGNVSQDSLLRHVREVVKDSDKNHPADFALWKKDDNHLMQWYSPWGWGFPGWHLECSVMAMKYLGETIDVHAGGEDLLFPHHECEVAQSECLTGKTFANYWLHTRFLQVDGEKMSKSKGNFFTVRDLIHNQGIDPRALRYALVSTPYTKPFNFTKQILVDASKKIKRFDEVINKLNENTRLKSESEDNTVLNILDKLYSDALDAMRNNLNTSVAIAKTLGAFKQIGSNIEEIKGSNATACLTLLKKFDSLLGFIFPKMETGTEKSDEDSSCQISDEINHLLTQRINAKKEKDYALADSIRNKIQEMGYKIIDTPEGSTVERF